MGHPMQIDTQKIIGAIILFSHLERVFPLYHYSERKMPPSDDFLIGVTFINGILFTLLLLLVT